MDSSKEEYGDREGKLERTLTDNIGCFHLISSSVYYD